MPDLRFWEEVRPGHSGEVVLAVDTPPGGVAASADFRALAPLLDTPHSLWRSLDQAGSPQRVFGLDEYTEPWISEVDGGGLRVRAVLGYGVGGIFAGLLAGALRRCQGRMPEVLLFDPELVDEDAVLGEFRRLRSGTAGTPAPVAAVRPARDPAPPSSRRGPAPAGTRPGASSHGETRGGDARALALELHTLLAQAGVIVADRSGPGAGPVPVPVAGPAREARRLAEAWLPLLTLEEQAGLYVPATVTAPKGRAIA
ncbi:hypothetical protein [Streptomyces sp. NPDC051921]|uniref:hypothetical protein n=1 Tax=Streptomyces sp. NPDC051921 TaxID=3155806 RepID=UPI0034297D9B